jgi:hypothetical protein
MKNLLIGAFCLFTVAGYGQPQKLPVIYDKMASEVYAGIVKHHDGHLNQYFESCLTAVIKKNTRGLMRLGIDSLHNGDIGRIGLKVAAVFRDKYPDVNSKIEEEMQKEFEKEDSIAKADMADLNKKPTASTPVAPTLKAIVSSEPAPDWFKSDAATPKDIPAAKKTYAWTGRIGTRTAFIWIAIKNDLIRGELSYADKKGNLPLKLIGGIDDKGLIRVFEYQADGYIVGAFVFDRISDSALGKWESTANHKAYPFKLQVKDTLMQRVDTSFGPKTIAGDYVYMYGDKGPQGSISLTKAEEYPNLFNIECSTSAAGGYANMSDKRSVFFKNNQCRYTIQGAATCTFQIKFYTDFLIVEYVKNEGDSANDCGTYKEIKGVYYKASL